ncbi:MAG: DUF4442 domain-containing protein [Chlorobi bacterium]|nr:DUF4442 domain-containing protein [Chlorobiota bacterium]
MQFTPFRLNLYLLRAVPLAWLAGIRVRETGPPRTLLSVRHRWINQNPFRSIYFGVLVMGGELATGIPLFREIYERNPDISMLVIAQEARFLKKARGIVVFEFTAYDRVKAAVDRARHSSEPVEVWLGSEARNREGEKVAEFRFLWSLKRRSAT